MELKIASFHYTKDDGQQSDRKLLVLSSPSNSYFGIEVDHDLTSIKQYIAYLEELQDLENNLKAKHGLADMKLPYKRFIDAKMSNVLIEKLDVDTEKL